MYIHTHISSHITYKTCRVVSSIFLPYFSVPSTHPCIQPRSTFHLIRTSSIQSIPSHYTYNMPHENSFKIPIHPNTPASKPSSTPHSLFHTPRPFFDSSTTSPTTTSPSPSSPSASPANSLINSTQLHIYQYPAFRP